MIVDPIVTVFTAVAQMLFSVLPLANLDALLTALGSTAHDLGMRAAPWNSFLPFDEWADALGLLLGVWLAALLIYKLANWVYRHFPSIAGFSLGHG